MSIHSDGGYRPYAHLPEDLIHQILEAVPKSASKLNAMFGVNEGLVESGIQKLKEENLIRKLDKFEYTDSVIAVDGGSVMERLGGADLLLVVAVGVEGLRSEVESGGGWSSEKNQYYQWQTTMVHDEATPRLMQGVMFLMELSVLANASYDVKIMDGTHFTPILKINSLLSAKEEHAGEEYIQALRDFLAEKYDKIIPDIPDIIDKALTDDAVVAIAKYSSSRDILDSKLEDQGITLDDKSFFYARAARKRIHTAAHSRAK